MTQSVKTTAQPVDISATSKVVKNTISPTPREQVFIVEAQRASDVPSIKSKDEFSHASTGEGKEDTKTSKKVESKKTLSDQVAEGKYGLIQNELFQEKPKRPGIISYLPNAEFTQDTKENYGGLSTDEIWLAENHLLVLKGGEFNNNSKDEPWKPIDNYVAPLRQVKIPENPKVPPPFPIQLEDNGPIHFIQSNQFPLINPFTNESLYLFPEDGFPKTETYGKDKTNLFARPGTIDASKVIDDNSYFNPASNATGLYNDKNFTFSNPFLSPEPLPPPEFYPPFPPFPIFINGSLENGNINDTFDEDDPSFYYPPPYSFFYKSNYTNPVKPGPLVPGIILPPPPNFFGRLETTTATTSRPTITTKHAGYSKIQHSGTTRKIITTTSTTPTKRPTITTVRPLMTSLKQVQVPKMIAFVPKEAIINDKGKPIYYEYFDANVKANVQAPYNPTLGPTIKTTLSASHKQNIKPHVKPTLPYRNTYLPPFDYNKYLYITPKPDVQPNGVSNEQQTNIVNTLTMQTFGKEVENIRHKLNYFKASDQKQQPLSLSQLQQRNPKSKAVYEYSFNMTPLNTNLNTREFIPPTEFDSTPFKPIVQYSLPLNSNDGFTAISTTTPPPLETTTVTSSQTPFTSLYTVLNAYQNSGQLYSTSKKPSIHYIPIETTVVKPDDVNSYNTYISAPQVDRPLQPFRSVTQTTHNPNKPISQQQNPWLSVEKQVLHEVHPNKINVQIQTYSPDPPPRPYLSFYTNDYAFTTTEKNKPYFYQQPPKNVPYIYQHLPQVSTPYVYPTRQLAGQENAYLSQIESLRQSLGNYPKQYHYEITNGTLFNHAVPRSPLKGKTRFVESYQIEQKRLPLLSHILPPHYNSRQRQQQQQTPAPALHKDILVNYKYPLPPINPDSELLPPATLLQPLPPVPIQHQHSAAYPHTLQYNRYGRLKQQPTVIQYKLPGEKQASVYFYTPHEEKPTQIDIK